MVDYGEGMGKGLRIPLTEGWMMGAEPASARSCSPSARVYFTALDEGGNATAAGAAAD